MAEGGPGAGRMTLANRSLGRARAAWRKLLGLLGPVPVTAPVFIVGCPRSGKSTLRKLLAPHPGLHFVTIRRHLARAYPFYDLDQPDAWSRGRQLALTAADERPPSTRRLQRSLWAEAGERRVLSDNATLSFRLGFLNRMFPDSLFVHVIRHGAAAALAIEAAAQAGRMWAKRPHMWQLVESHAQGSERYAPCLELCTTDYLRGLLQWRMTVETVREAARAHLQSGRYCEVRFEQLVAEPQNVCGGVQAFIGLQPDPAVHARAVELRLAPPPAPEAYPAGTEALAGDLFRELAYAVF